MKISDDLKTMSIETRIPTLFEIGTPVSNSDGALSIDWQEGRGLDWQQPAKNPHPNRYVFVFRDGAFKEDSLATFMNSDPRIKALIQKENVALADFQRGSKRSRDEVDSKPAKASSSSTEGEKTAKKDGLKKSASSTEVDQTKSKPAQKKHSQEPLAERAVSRYLPTAPPKSAPGGSRLFPEPVLPCVLPRGGPLRGRLPGTCMFGTERRPPPEGVHTHL